LRRRCENLEIRRTLEVGFSRATPISGVRRDWNFEAKKRNFHTNSARIARDFPILNPSKVKSEGVLPSLSL
jgi:hypothetical protein